jgi:hypothetical protein
MGFLLESDAASRRAIGAGQQEVRGLARRKMQLLQ